MTLRESGLPTAGRTIQGRTRPGKRTANHCFTQLAQAVAMRHLILLLLLAGCGATPEQALTGAAALGVEHRDHRPQSG